VREKYNVTLIKKFSKKLNYLKTKIAEGDRKMTISISITIRNW